MDNLLRSRIGSGTRRMLFVAVLLLIGPLTVSVFHYLQTPTMARLPTIGIFAWGIDSIGTVLAVWLVARTGVWRSWSGFVRMAIYITAFAYGRMLFSAVQDWWVAPDAAFRYPGTEVDDYARPALDLLSLLMNAWLLTPVVFLTAMGLTASGDVAKRSKHFTLAGLIAFTATAAISLAWIQFLTSDLAPETAYSHLSHSAAIREWVGAYLPFAIPTLIAAALMLYGLAKRWWIALLFFFAAVLLDGVGTKAVAMIESYLMGQQEGGILGGALVDSMPYILGRSLTIGCAFATASILGVRPTFGRIKETDTAKESDDGRVGSPA